MASRDPEIWMWAEACELIERAERLHRQFFQLGRSRARGPTWEPPVDVFEADGELRILVALPGVNSAQIEVIADAGVLVVAGERRIPIASQAIIHRLEIPYGRFERRIDLPPGLFEIGRREVADGCLLISLHKLE